MKLIIKYLIILIIAASLAMVVYFRIYIPKHTFKTVHPLEGILHVRVNGTGNVSALHIYSITAQTGGKILKILTDEGRWVKKGDLLIVMDGVDLPQQLEIAKADFVRSEYDVKALQSELKNQRAQKIFMQVTYNRYKKLDKQGFAARSEYDKASADLQSIKASISATIARIKSAESGVVAASKKITALKEKIERLKVYSPVNGYVIAKEAEVARNVLPSTPVLKIVDPKTLWVETRIDERISSQVKLFQKASIVLRSHPFVHYKGIVKRIGAVSDPVTLERTIDVAFQTFPKPFFINEQAQVTINVMQYNNVVKVPLSVVVQKEGKAGMWIVKKNHAHFVFLDTAVRGENEIQVPDRCKDDFVIIPNPHKKTLKEGMRIYRGSTVWPGAREKG